MTQQYILEEYRDAVEMAQHHFARMRKFESDDIQYRHEFTNFTYRLGKCAVWQQVANIEKMTDEQWEEYRKLNESYNELQLSWNY